MVGKMMVTVAAGLLVVGSGVAHANPAVPMMEIEDSAAQLCGIIDANPTGDGVLGGMNSFYGRGFDDVDAALATLVAVHHACPQHQELIFGVLDPLAADELCEGRTESA